MSVNRAYITSLGTTAILVASSLLVLAVTSTIVAFDGWPGHSAAAAVDRVTVKVPAVAAQPVPAASASSVTAATRTRVTAAGVAGTPGARRAPPPPPAPPPGQPLPGGGGTTSGTGTPTGSPRA